MAQTIVLKNIAVGEQRAITIESRLASTHADKNPSSATMLVYDHNPDAHVSGTADSGSTTTLADADLTQANDYWNGLPIEITDTSGGVTEETEITDFVANTDTLNFNAVSFTVAAGDTYRILGTPVLTDAAATVSGNEVSRTATPSDVTARPRDLTVVAKFTFSASDIQECVAKLTVVPSRLRER